MAKFDDFSVDRQHLQCSARPPSLPSESDWQRQWWSRKQSPSTITCAAATKNNLVNSDYQRQHWDIESKHSYRQTPTFTFSSVFGCFQNTQKSKNERSYNQRIFWLILTNCMVHWKRNQAKDSTGGNLYSAPNAKNNVFKTDNCCNTNAAVMAPCYWLWKPFKMHKREYDVSLPQGVLKDHPDTNWNLH